MLDEPTTEAEPTTPSEGSAAVAAAYVQLISTWAPTEGSAAAAMTTPDANGRLPVVVRVGGPGTIRWEPLAGAAGVFLFAFVFNPPPVFWAAVLVLVVLLVALALIGRLFIRVPEGAWGLASRRLRYERTLSPGVYTVPPWLTLTHLVSRRDIVFDAPVAAAPSSDGVRVDVDILVTLRVVDPAKFVYQVSVSDFDQFAQAAIQDSVRSLVRATPALEALDLGPEQATRLKAALGKATGPFGVEIAAVTFTRVGLPPEMSASLEARKLASVHLAEEAERFALEQKKLEDRAALESIEQAERRGSVENEAEVEALRLKYLEQRLKANPNAAHYDLELARIRVAEGLATNSRAVVSLGGRSDLGTAFLAIDPTHSIEGPPEPAPAPPRRQRKTT